MLYPEAESKIIQAYFRDEIKPMDPNFCFCGILNGNSDGWCAPRSQFKGKYYSFQEYTKMEYALLSRLKKFGIEYDNLENKAGPGWWTGDVNTKKKGYEEALFDGMCKALEVLKQIHIDRGENIDPVPFKKRELIS